MFAGHVITEQVAAEHVHAGTEGAFVHDVATAHFPREVVGHGLDAAFQRQLHPLLGDGRGRQRLALRRTTRLCARIVNLARGGRVKGRLTDGKREQKEEKKIETQGDRNRRKKDTDT